MNEIDESLRIQESISGIIWAHSGRSTVGFVRIENNNPSSLGSGTLIRFGDVFGILTCAHVLEAIVKENEIGLLCFPVRAGQIQRLQLSMAATDYVTIGAPPWKEGGPDLAFLRLPAASLGDIQRVASIVNGGVHRQNIMAGEPSPSRKLCAIAGVVDEMTKPVVVDQIAGGFVATTPFEAVLNVGNVFVDDEAADRFRFQPVTSQGVILPSTYKGTSGAGLWKYYLQPEDFSLIQARLIGVVYWEKRVQNELHLIGHGQISVYQTLFDAIRAKWP